MSVGRPSEVVWPSCPAGRVGVGTTGIGYRGVEGVKLHGICSALRGWASRGAAKSGVLQWGARPGAGMCPMAKLAGQSTGTNEEGGSDVAGFV